MSPSDTPTLLTGSRALARSLAWLRLCAIAGQSITIFITIELFGIPLAPLPLFSGIGILAIFNVYANWRLKNPKSFSEWEVVAHVAVDTLILSYLLYWTGGAENPFIALLLIPIALAATALSTQGIMATAALAGMAYVLLVTTHHPLAASEYINSTKLTIAGMAVNFTIMGSLLAVFISRLAIALRAQIAEVQRIRERALRDEGILAIATQAAGAAHEMNTPLSTMRTLLPELRREYTSNTPLTNDLLLLEEQVDRCRTSLRDMVALGKAQLSQSPKSTTLRQFMQTCLEQFQLLRPEAELDFTPITTEQDTPLLIQPGLRHALINLLNNAADASAQNHSHKVRLEAFTQDEHLILVIGDNGPGFNNTDHLAYLGQSGKRTGLGLGLTLAAATAERLNGKLLANNHTTGGEVRLRLPLSHLLPT